MENNASKINNLTHQEAIDKFKELVKHESICLFTTRLSEVPLTTRPMGIQEVCDQGNFWFMSPSDSDKNQEVAMDSRVQLFISNPSKYEFLSVYGKAYVSRDPDKIDKYWSEIAKAWFPKGKDDPRITIIKVVPEEGFYWDTKDGKLVSMIKIAASAISGKTLEEGVEGTISIR
ncbi:MAG: pyridoxamine 5'-phosphate oxidase family protein [Chryseolinea sp.]